MRDRFPRPGLSGFRCLFPCGFRSLCGWVSRVRPCLCPCGPHARPIPAPPCRVSAFVSAVVLCFPVRLGAAGSSALVPLRAQCAIDSRVSLPCVHRCRPGNPCVHLKMQDASRPSARTRRAAGSGGKPRLPLRLGAAGSSALVPKKAKCAIDSRVSLPCVHRCRTDNPCVGFRRDTPERPNARGIILPRPAPVSRTFPD